MAVMMVGVAEWELRAKQSVYGAASPDLVEERRGQDEKGAAAVSGLRLAKSKTSITSIAELKKAIEYAFVRGEFASENVMFALKRFEASVREKINEIKERDERTLQVSGVPSGAHPILEELRRIFGGDKVYSPRG